MSKLSFAEFVDLHNATFGYPKEDFIKYLNGGFPRSRPTPKLHTEIADYMQECHELDEKRVLIQAFRGAAKSYLSQLFNAWVLYIDPMMTTIILCAAGDLAKKQTESIRGILEMNPLTEHLIDPKNTWMKTQLTVTRPGHLPEPSLKMLSMTGRITGNRSKRLIGDDIEVSDNCQTPEAREYNKSRLRECEMIVSDGSIWLIGTPHHVDSIYETAIGEMDFKVRKWPIFESDGATCRWPEKFNNKVVSRLQTKLTKGEWKSQYILIPSSVYETIIDTQRLQNFHLFDWDIEIVGSNRNEIGTVKDTYAIRNPKTLKYETIESIQCYWDVASGLEGNDDSVLCIAAKTEIGNIYVLFIEALSPTHEDYGFSVQIEELLYACKKYGVNTINIEKSGIGFAIGSDVKKHASAVGQKINIKEIDRAINKKIFMAKMIEPLTKVGRLFICKDGWTKGKLKDQLRDLGTAKQVDFTDALAGCIWCLKGGKFGVDQSNSKMTIRKDNVDFEPVIGHYETTVRDWGNINSNNRF